VVEADEGTLHFVCTLDELAPGTMRRVDIGNRALAVCRSAETGEVFALAARCPHQGAMLCDGKLTGTTLESASNTYVYGRRGEILRCPWHSYEYDVRTGWSVHREPRLRTATYPVVIESGNIYVNHR
jgi:3-phenylpropionate/trans-cinnamate dioxygenase ferredoxin subunit